MYKVSVIIPVYNVEDYLRETIDSIINQTMKDFEVIFIDDGSTDSSVNIIKEYIEKNENMKLICQENMGPSVARNKGIELAEGEYIAFMDSDDKLPKDSLELRYNLAKENEAEVIICGTYKFDEEKKWPMIKHFLEEGEKDIIKDEDLLWTLGPCNKLFKSSFIKENKFPEDIKYAEDQVLVLESYLKAKKIIATQKVGYYYRIRPANKEGSLTSQIKDKSLNVLDQVYKSWTSTLENIDKYCKDEKKKNVLKINYFSRLIKIDIWPPLRHIIISEDESVQLEGLDKLEKLINTLSLSTINSCDNLLWILTEGFIRNYKKLTKESKKRYLEILKITYENTNIRGLKLYIKRIEKNKFIYPIIYTLIKKFFRTIKHIREHIKII